MSTEITYYKEVVSWQIRLYIKYVKENNFPYQQNYWLQNLKQALKVRKKLLKNHCKPYTNQLRLF